MLRAFQGKRVLKLRRLGRAPIVGVEAARPLDGLHRGIDLERADEIFEMRGISTSTSTWNSK